MTRISGKALVVWLFAAAMLTAWPGDALAQTITCSAGSLGTVNTQATITGPNSMTMATNGSITYPTPLTGPASSTPITCTLSGWGANKNIDIDCDATRVISNAGGCCGTIDRNMTAFSAFGSGNSTDGPSDCNGMGGSSTLKFRTSGSGTGTLVFGATMDATNVRIGGTYRLSNNAAGVLNIETKEGGTTRTTTADFTVTFASLVGFSSQVDMQFGKIGFTPPVTGSSASLGTNGAVTYAGSFTGQGGTVTAGSVRMNNVQDGVTVEIYCDTTAVLARAGASSSTIQVTGIQVAAENARGAYGTGSACNGIAGAPATTMLYAAGARDEFFLGGILNGATATSFTGGSYSTANAGGDDIQVTVLNQ